MKRAIIPSLLFVQGAPSQEFPIYDLELNTRYPIEANITGNCPDEKIRASTQLLVITEKYVKDNDYKVLRGPINEPSFYGGWGVRIAGYNRKPLVNSSENISELEHLEKQTIFLLLLPSGILVNVLIPISKFYHIQLMSFYLINHS